MALSENFKEKLERCRVNTQPVRLILYQRGDDNRKLRVTAIVRIVNGSCRAEVLDQLDGTRSALRNFNYRDIFDVEHFHAPC